MTAMDVRDKAADIIEPHVEGRFRIRDRAVATADDLAESGLLAGQQPRVSPSVPVRQAAANVLQCRTSWDLADKIAAELDAAGLLANH